MPTEKKAFVLRISPETLKELERWAQDEFRSVNGQIEYLLNDALRNEKNEIGINRMSRLLSRCRNAFANEPDAFQR